MDQVVRFCAVTVNLMETSDRGFTIQFVPIFGSHLKHMRSWTIILMTVWMEWNIELVKSVPYEGSTCAGRKSEEKS